MSAEVSGVPAGTRLTVANPGAEAPGYCRESLRDFFFHTPSRLSPTIHAPFTLL
mgnify:CR=1 FL=1